MSFTERAILIGVRVLAPLFGSVTFYPPPDKRVTDLRTLEPGWTGRRRDGSQATLDAHGNPIVPTGGDAGIGVDDDDVVLEDIRPRPGHQQGVIILANGTGQFVTEMGVRTGVTALPGAKVEYHGPTVNSSLPGFRGRIVR